MDYSVTIGVIGVMETLKNFVELSIDKQERCNAREINHQLERLEFWMDYYGARHPKDHPASLESRLGESFDVLNNITKLMGSINVAANKLPDTIPDQHDTVSLSGRKHSIPDVEEPSGLESLEEIRSWIDRLYQESSLIDPGARRDTFAHTLNNALNNSHDLFPDLQDELLQIEVSFPKLATNEYSWLQQRLARTVSARRRCLGYYRDICDHRENFEQCGIPETNPMGMAIRNPSFICLKGKPGMGKTSLLCSLVDIPRRIQRQDGLSSPPFPTPSGAREHPIRHIDIDLNPYMCTFEDCDALLFSDVDDWFSHEMSYHRITLTCPICENAELDTEESLHQHLWDLHPEHLTLLQKYDNNVLFTACRKPVEIIQGNECPCCTEWLGDDRISGTPDEFKTHLAAHLEKLATFSLSTLPSTINGDLPGSSASKVDCRDADSGPGQVEWNLTKQRRCRQFTDLPSMVRGARRNHLRELELELQRTQKQYLESLLTFKEFLEGAKKIGQTCDQAQVEYIPRTATRQFWSLDKIEKTLGGFEISSSEISPSRLLIFSILVHISSDQAKLDQAIKYFIRAKLTDSDVPLHSLPVVLDEAVSRSVWDNFYAAQWMFCPASVGPESSGHAELHRKQVLPVTQMGVLGMEDATNVRTVTIKPQTVSDFTDEEPSQLLLFKQYGPEESDSFHRERDLLTSLREVGKSHSIVSTQHFTRSLGSFSWNDDAGQCHYTLVLEHGSTTLADIFHGNDVPASFLDFKAFWTSLLGVLKGACQLHSFLSEAHSHYGPRTCVHQDLKPANILVFDDRKAEHKSEGFSRFRKHMKIANFGLRPPHDLEKSNRTGIQTYSSPELAQALDQSRIVKTRDNDTWAVCCILLEAAVWVTGGEAQRLRFHEARSKESKPTLSREYHSLGLSDCFHNGHSVLQCVKDVPSLIQKHSSIPDTISSGIATTILDEVLGKPTYSRASAQRLLSRLGVITQHAEDPWSSPTRHTFSGLGLLTFPIHYAQNPNDVDCPPYESLSQRHECQYNTLTRTSQDTLFGHNWQRNSSDYDIGEQARRASANTSHGKGQSYHYNHMDSVVENRRLKLCDLPHWRQETKESGTATWPQDLAYAKKLLTGRDFILIIDDSQSMQQWKSKAMEDASNMVALLKQIDGDGIDMKCSSSWLGRKTHSFTSAARFLQANYGKEQSETFQGELTLTKVVDGIISGWGKPLTFLRRKKKFSIFIFTDGSWGPPSKKETDVNSPFSNLKDTMRTSNLKRNHVSFQFIQYGSYPLTTEKTDLFTNDIRWEKYHQDIVDHKSNNDPLDSILIATLGRHEGESYPTAQCSKVSAVNRTLDLSMLIMHTIFYCGR